MKQSITPFGNEHVRLRLLVESDLELILSWRNREDARIWFKDSSVISMDQHKRWFEQYIDKENDLHFILEVDKKPVGQASVYHIHREKEKAEIGRFLVAPGDGGKGYIKQACGELIRFCNNYLKLKYIFLEVMAENHKAIALYKKCGFMEETRYNGLIRMGQYFY